MQEMEGRKNDAGKERHDLIRTKTLRGLAKVLEFGARKYAPDNWVKVPNARDRYYAAAQRHILSWRDGETKDEETGLNHLWHAVCCLMFLDNLPEPEIDLNAPGLEDDRVL